MTTRRAWAAPYRAVATAGQLHTWVEAASQASMFEQQLGRVKNPQVACPLACLPSAVSHPGGSDATVREVKNSASPAWGEGVCCHPYREPLRPRMKRRGRPEAATDSADWLHWRCGAAALPRRLQDAAGYTAAACRLAALALLISLPRWHPPHSLKPLQSFRSHFYIPVSGCLFCAAVRGPQHTPAAGRTTAVAWRRSAL
jgi:hypothetical protein